MTDRDPRVEEFAAKAKRLLLTEGLSWRFASLATVILFLTQANDRAGKEGCRFSDTDHGLILELGKEIDRYKRNVKRLEKND